MAESALHEVVARALHAAVDSVGNATSAATLRRGSLRHLDLMTAVEDAYDVRFSTAEIPRATSVSAIRRLLRENGVDVA